VKTQSPSWTWHELAMLHSLAIYCAIYTENHLSALTHRQCEHPDLSISFQHLLDPYSGFIGQELALPYFGWTPFEGEEAVSRQRGNGAGMSLLLAARLGLTHMVEWLLSFNGVKCDINFVCCMRGWPHRGPALAEASARGHVDTVRLLLNDQYRAPLDVDRQIEKYKMTALHRAASYSHEEIVRLLISAGADVNVQNFFTGAALHFASYRRNASIIRMLLAHGADVNAIGGWAGCSPLQIATSEGGQEVVQLLIDAGAKVNYVNPRSREDIGNRLPLELAVERGYEDIVELLLLESGADVTSR
jgi:ankyrin repeat protein